MLKSPAANAKEINTFKIMKNREKLMNSKKNGTGDVISANIPINT
jgi:hypothetical protein